MWNRSSRRYSAATDNCYPKRGSKLRGRDVLAALIVVFWATAAFKPWHCHAEEHGAPPGRRGAVIAEFTVERDGAPLVIPVTMEVAAPGAPSGRRWSTFKMLLDTGAPCTLFDVAHRKELGAPVRRSVMRSPFGALEIDIFQTPRMRFDRIEVQPRGGVACLDLRHAMDIIHEKIDGVLGMDVLFAMVVSIDFDEGRVCIHRAADPAVGRPVPIDRNSGKFAGCPVVRGAVADRPPMEFLVDTGGSGMFAGGIDGPTYDRLTDDRLIIPSWRTREAKFVNGNVQVKLGRSRAFAIGDDVHRGLIFGRLPICALGLGFLSRYFVVFDFPKNVMYLRPGKGFSRPDHLDLSAMEIARFASSVAVLSLTEGGPAATAGIRKGDQILTIDGTEVEKTTVMAIRRVLSETGHHRLGIRRGQAYYEAVVDLKDELWGVRGVDADNEHAESRESAGRRP